MVYKNCVLIPQKVLEDLNSLPLESKENILKALVECSDTKYELIKAKTTIAELESQVGGLQKALDVLHQNKCRTRKVKVKYIGRTKNVCKNNSVI